MAGQPINQRLMSGIVDDMQAATLINTNSALAAFADGSTMAASGAVCDAVLAEVSVAGTTPTMSYFVIETTAVTAWADERACMQKARATLTSNKPGELAAAGHTGARGVCSPFVACFAPRAVA